MRYVIVAIALVLTASGALLAAAPRPDAAGAADESAGSQAQVSPVVGMSPQVEDGGGPIVNDGGPAINHGSFGGAPYALVDPAAVTAYKAEASLIGAGGYTSDLAYKTMEATVISFDGGTTYVTDRGGCIYIQSVIADLQAGDIVEVDNNYYYDDGSGYASYWNQAPYWVLINSYTHSSTNTINNWLIYFEPDGSGGYTMVAGSGEYNLAAHTDDLTTIIGDKFRLTRDVKVWRGATLVSPLTSSRGYTYSSTGITGGTVVASAALDQTDMTYVGADPVYVDDGWTANYNGDVVAGHVFGQDAFASIQRAIAGALGGGTVNVAAGTYDEPLNIEGKTTLSIIGEDKDTTIVKSSTTLPWNVGGYGTSRQSMVRIVNSTDILLRNMTLDCDLIKGNNKFGVSGWDSSVTLDNCVVQNMSAPDSSGYYAELSSYFRAPGFSDTSRANVTVSNCTFANAGRVGVVTHDYITAMLVNNVFYKTLDDFGYAMEVGSQSTGVVSGNLIYGYDTPAASDGSESAGIYIENCFTSTSSPVTKTVLVENNEVYDCQYAMWIGNGYDGYAGDVDIVVTLNDNNFHDNVDGGAIVQDEDKAAGSSVSVSGSNNTWKDNGTYGLHVLTQGDGDVSVDLSGQIISGQDTGVYVEDTSGGTGSSSYSVSVTQSRITGNTSYGVNNTVSGLTVNASNNWWGAADGPGPVGPGSGDNVSTNVNYSPYLAYDIDTNVLKLDVGTGSNPIYLQPGDTVLIDMDALNLAQHVHAVQAFLTFSSTYFVSTQTGPGSPVVAAGGGVWDQLIYSMWNTGGDLDVAVGVDLTSVVGTKADGTVAKFTLTSTGTEGTTEMEFRPDGGSDVDSTLFSDANAQPIYPGSKIDSQPIVIDGTAPTGVTITADPSGWTNVNTVTLTFSATDPLSGIDHYELSIDSGTWFTAVSPYALDVSVMTDGTHAAAVKAIDRSGNEATASTNFYLDKTKPVIAIPSAQQNSAELLTENGSTTSAIQGQVDIDVTASDAMSGLAAPPTVTVTDSASAPMTVTYDGEGPTGTFNYHVAVVSTTTNGIATITASVSDNAGNSESAAAKHFNVNKTQIGGTVSFSTLSSSSYSINRNAVFVATDAGGTALKTWTVSISFTNAAGTATGTYTLTGVPSGVINLSAKDAWTLRKKQAVTFDGNDQATSNFVLLGGDINGSNSINVLDYSVLKLNWGNMNPANAANINGDALGVQLLDYSIMKTNWFKVGDAQ